MPALSRRAKEGFTLLELVVAVALLLPVVMLATGVALAAGRDVGQAAIAAAVVSAQEDAAIVLEAELAPLVVGDGLLAITLSTVRYRARRSAGRWCQSDSAGVVVPLSGGHWAASRLPVFGRDSLVLLLPDSLVPTARRLVRVPLAGAPASSPCPGGTSGLWLPAQLAGPPGPVDEVVQTEEVVELAGYLSNGETWLGLRSLALGSPIEPVAGPFGPAGVLFEGLDAGGAVTYLPAQIRAIRILAGSANPKAPPRIIVVALRG